MCPLGTWWPVPPAGRAMSLCLGAAASVTQVARGSGGETPGAWAPTANTVGFWAERWSRRLRRAVLTPAWSLTAAKSWWESWAPDRPAGKTSSSLAKRGPGGWLGSQSCWMPLLLGQIPL